VKRTVINRVGFVSVLLTGLIALVNAGIPDSLAHPDFTLRKVPFATKYKTMGISFLDDGRMAMAVTDFIGGGEVPKQVSTGTKVLLVTGYGATSTAGITVEEIANGFYQLVGTTIANGKLYVSDRDGFYEIQQLSKPADLLQNRKLVVNWPTPDGGYKWGPGGFSWHQFVFTPMYSKGSFYAPYSGSIINGGHSGVPPTSLKSGAFLKWDLAGKMENFAGGLRSPNGANLDPATGDMFVADNQGSWLPSSTFAQMKPGKFYGHRQSSPQPANWAEDLPYEPPTAWLPHGTVRASPSQPVVVPKGKYAGDWLMGDVNNPGLIRVALDKVGEIYNGSVFFFSKGTGNAAINRLTWGPDGALYMGTLSTIAGNWPGNADQDMYRLAPNATSSAFEMKVVRSLADGLELEFTQPVDAATVLKTAFVAKQWSYIRQPEYGQGKQPDQNLTVTDVEVSTDKLRVHLKIAGLVKDRTINIKHTGITSGGKAPWNDETWYTLNAVSSRTWNATVGTRNVVARVSRPAGEVDYRMDTRGLMSVTVKAEGTWNAVLVSPQGAIVARQAGTGYSRFTLPVDHHVGLHLLRVELKEGMVVRRVML
jgi:hypothetical protein